MTVISAIMLTRRASRAVTPVPRRRFWAPAPASASRSVIASTTEPMSAPPSTMATVHPMMGLRCNRSASPSGVAYRAGAAAFPGRWGTSPAPKSRRASSWLAVASRTAVSPRSSSNGHHRLPPYGCIC
jgi:hypothetical protein